MATTMQIYCNLQELQHLPPSDDYLFHNYPWKHHPAFQNIMMLEFPEDAENTEIYSVYRELWKLRNHLPSLKRNWA